MKVLMIGPARSVHGGISGVVNNYYDAGLDKKIDLTYIGTMVDGSKVRKLLQAGIALVKYVCCLPGTEIVHVNVASDASFMRKSVFIRLAHLAGKKLVLHHHGGDFVNYYEKGSAKRRAYVKRIFGMADTVLVLSDSWKQFWEKVLPEQEIILLPNAVQIPQQNKKQYGQHKILFLGRLCKDKGIAELLSCIPKLAAKYPDLMLYLGGIWEDSQLQKEAEKYPEHVKWLGWINGEDKARYLQECDIFVLPTYFEGLPVSLLEAMASSCAVAATRVGGIPMVVTEEQDGILTEPKDAEALFEMLDRLLGDKLLCEKLGNAARQKIQQKYSLSENINRLVGIYRKLAEK